MTAEADGASDTGHVTANAEADAMVKTPSISCDICATSPDDLDGDPNDCLVSLLDNGVDHLVTYTITVTNDGQVALADLTVTTECQVPSFSLAPNTATTIVCQVTQNCEDTARLTQTVEVSGGVDTSVVECPPTIDLIETTCRNIIDCVPCEIECTIDGPAPVCAGAADLQYSGPAGMTSYTWTIVGDGTIDGAAKAQTVTVDAGAAGSFTLMLTITDANGCSSTCEKPAR